MGVKIKRINVVLDTNGYYIRPVRLNITEEKILKYVKDNHMPEDSEYSSEDLILDLADPNDNRDIYTIYTLPFNIKEETMRYIEKLIDELRDDRR